MARMNRPWTEEEDKELLRLKEEKIPFGEIAQRISRGDLIKRTARACRNRYKHLKIVAEQDDG